MSFRTVLVAALALLLAGGAVAFYYAGQEPGPLVKIDKPAAIGGGGVALDVTVDSLGTALRALDVSVEQQGRVFRLFSLDAPGSARFAQETPHRMRITQESPPGAITGLRGERFAGLNDRPEYLLRWDPLPARTVRSYEVQRAESPNGVFERVNSPDLLCSAYMISARPGYYRVAARDFWDRLGEASDIIQVV